MIFFRTMFAALAFYDGETTFSSGGAWNTDDIYASFGIAGSSNNYQALTSSEIIEVDLDKSSSSTPILTTFTNEIFNILENNTDDWPTTPTLYTYDFYDLDPTVTVASSPVVGVSETTPADATSDAITLSSQFTSMSEAISACPNYKDVCGERIRELDTDSSTETLTPEIFLASQECHYLIKTTTCGFPVIMIDTEDDFVPGKFVAHWAEYQEGVATLDGETDYLLPDDWYYINMFSPYMAADTYGEIAVTDDDGHVKYMGAEAIKMAYDNYKESIMLHNIFVGTYNDDAEDYNDAVDAVEAELPGWLDGTLVPGETRGERGHREEKLTKLPLRPFFDVPEPEYQGYVIGDGAEYVSGFGMPTSGIFDNNWLRNGQYKHFGVYGQGGEEGVLATANPEDADDADTCSTKYTAINIFPLSTDDSVYDMGLLGGAQQSLEQWKFSITTEEMNDYDFGIYNAPEYEIVKPKKLSTSPFVKADSAAKLMASTAAALTALYLF